ncbi:zinc finger CCCH domain-containing protein, partial [Trifolium medium]|nr:zinc finger CCCH domain-containing protein [Trifolium medium]
MELDGKEKNLGPVSSVPENPEVIRPEHDMDENDAMLKASVPSHEELTLKKEEIPVKQEVLTSPKTSENLIPAEDGKNQGSNVDVENSGYLLQRKTFGGCSEP